MKRTINIKIPAGAAAILTLICSIMAAACAFGIGGTVIAMLAAAVTAALMIMSNPFLAALPAAVVVGSCFLGADLSDAVPAFGAILAGALIYAAFRAGVGLSAAGAVCGVVFLISGAASIYLWLRANYGSASEGVSALKAVFAGMVREMADAASSAYGAAFTVADSDIESLVGTVITSLPGIALFAYQIVGIAAACLTAAVLRICGAGAALLPPDGRWRCTDSVSLGAVYILSQFCYGISGMFGENMFYFISYNAMTAFLPAALCIGVRTLFTARGPSLPRPLKVGALVFAALFMCMNPIAVLLVIALAGSTAVCVQGIRQYLESKKR